MSEADWDRCTDPRRMLEWLQGRGRLSERKARLFAVACCSRIWPLLTDQRSRSAVEVAERYADGIASGAEREAAAQGAWQARSCMKHFNALDAAWDSCGPAEATLDAAEAAAHEVAWAAATEDEQLEGTYLQNPAGQAAYQAERTSQAAMLRDLFNPFRTASFDPAARRWNSGTAVALARQMYETRDFTLAPLLADMLEDAGTTDSQLLEHCRSRGPHVRGCFATDLSLGKS